MDKGGEFAAPGSEVASAANVAAGVGRFIDPKPLVERSRNWPRYFGPAVSLLLLAAALYQLRDLKLGDLTSLLPTSPLFWIVFVVSYFQAPFTDWIMFRRLWGLPFSGMGALLRKFVSNEILLGYLGEVYFYAWAKRHVNTVASPFGAIKDVTILSALTGNISTIVMVILAAPMIGQLNLGISSNTFAWSIAFVLGTSVAFLVLRRTLFTLPSRDLWFIANVHFLRIISYALLSGLLWHLILPGVAFAYWLLLATMRQLLSRLPFMPNKDVIFVSLATFFVGRDTEIVHAMALLASLTVAAHLVVGLTFGLSGLIRERNS
ncbi:hypothetical protein KK488_13985 [Sphingobium sp. H33]|uniref:Uncharacterized protein n=2 Tax=Sphingobium nicotianae TaxID=2782607 RepID=A0A9X1DDS1_9SPHN|nr:hypothetical protein [Sphingobium nicotianae]